VARKVDGIGADDTPYFQHFLFALVFEFREAGNVRLAPCICAPPPPSIPSLGQFGLLKSSSFSPTTKKTICMELVIGVQAAEDFSGRSLKAGVLGRI
jgi:hypothetical protein